MPGLAACTSDLDGDGICDNLDSDRDGDGVGNAKDPFPDDKDVVPPEVTLDTSYPPVVETAPLSISGRVVDPGTGAAPPLRLTSSRTPGFELRANPDPSGHFRFAGFRLTPGENVITIVATDRAKLVTRTVVRLTYLPPISVTILSPLNGSHSKNRRINISGRGYAEDDGVGGVRVSLGDQRPQPLVRSDLTFTFTFRDVLLQPGFNRIAILAQTSYGSGRNMLDVYYDPPAVANDRTGPIITVLAPDEARPIHEDSLTLVAQVRDGIGVGPVTVNGVAALTTGDVQACVSDAGAGCRGASDTRYRRVESWVNLSGAADGPVKVQLKAADVAGNKSLRVLTYTRDAHPPAIVLEAPAVTQAGVAHVVENPLTLRGTVSDVALAGLQVNGLPVALAPTAVANTFRFAVDVSLNAGVEQPVVLDAWDTAGGSSQLRFAARLDAAARLEIVEPVDGARLLTSSGSHGLAIVALTEDVPEGAVAHASLGGRTLDLVRDGRSFSGSLDVAGLAGPQELRVAIAGVDNQPIVATTRRFELVDEAAVALALTRADPANGAGGIEPNTPLAFYFNKPVAEGDLSIEVRESIHGFEFDLDHPGARLPINRDQVPVAGRLAVLPGGRLAMLYPARQLAYGAAIFITIRHRGQELGRTGFQVRPLPTLAYGTLADQFGEPVSGALAQLPDLGLSAITDNDGGFSFGFGNAGDAVLPPGRHRIVFNPGLKNPRFGTAERWAVIEEASLNGLDPTRVPRLNAEVPFVRIASGQDRVELAGGDLVLGLAQAQLLFPDQRREGAVHVQFADATQILAESLPSAEPLWAFQAQPPGVRVAGPISVQITPPSLYGSRHYLPADGALVLLVGLDERTKVLRPAGVAEMSGGLMLSRGALQLELLDYIGVRLVSSATQPLLRQYADGAISLRQLTRGLEQ